VPERLGNAHPNIVPYQVFPTADGHFILAVGNDDQFRRFCDAAGLAGVGADARFASNDDRIHNRDALVDLIAAATSEHPAAYWIETLGAVNVPCGPVNTLDQVFSHPQIQARGMVVEMPSEAAGGADVRLTASPVKLSATPVDYRHAPPALGQHTGTVLKELLGLDADALAGLVDKGVIGPA